MARAERLTWLRGRSRVQEWIAGGLEYATLALTSPDGPGPWMRALYRLPVWLTESGFAALVPHSVMLLTVPGRRSGRDRTVALSYQHDPDHDVYFVVAGWGTRSHWYRNLEASPRVKLRLGNRRITAVASNASDEVSLALYRHQFDTNPFAARSFAQITGGPADTSDRGLLELARRCPVVALRVEQD